MVSRDLVETVSSSRPPLSGDREALSRVISPMRSATFRRSLLTLVESAVGTIERCAAPQIVGRDVDLVSFPRERITRFVFDTANRLPAHLFQDVMIGAWPRAMTRTYKFFRSREDRIANSCRLLSRDRSLSCTIV